MATSNEWWKQGSTPVEAPDSGGDDWWAQGATALDGSLPKPATPSRSLADWGRDIAATAVKGAIGVPEAAVGLADLVTGGYAGKAVEGAVVRFKEAKDIADSWSSDATKAARQKFDQAEGIGGKFKAAIENPSNIVTAVGESLPSMAAGGVAARGLMAATRLGQMGVKGAALAGAGGEGVIGAGSAAEQIRQQTDNGLLSARQTGLAGLSGLATAGIGAAGGAVARRLGIGDVDTMFAQGVQGIGDLSDVSLKSIPKQVIQGAVTEGLLEELPQSVAETIFQNLALDRPWTEGVDASVVLGTLSGGAMGAGAAGLRGAGARRAQRQQDQQDSAAKAAVREAFLDQLNQRMAPVLDEQALANAGVRPMPPTSLDEDRIRRMLSDEPNTALGAGDPNAKRSDVQGPEAPDLTTAPQWGTEAGAGVPRQGLDMPAPEIDTSGLSLDIRTPSQRMGIDQAAGPLSRGAAVAVDGGATAQITGGTNADPAAPVVRVGNERAPSAANAAPNGVGGATGSTVDTQPDRAGGGLPAAEPMAGLQSSVPDGSVSSQPNAAVASQPFTQQSGATLEPSSDQTQQAAAQQPQAGSQAPTGRAAAPAGYAAAPDGGSGVQAAGLSGVDGSQAAVDTWQDEQQARITGPQRFAVRRIEASIRRQTGDSSYVLQPVESLVGEGRQEFGFATRIAREAFGLNVIPVSQPGTRVFNGAQSGDNLLLDIDTEKPAMAVVGHEILHQLRRDDPLLYRFLRVQMERLLKPNAAGDYAAQLREKYKDFGLDTLSDDASTEELLADIVGDQFGQREFWDAMAEKNERLTARIARKVMAFLERFLGTARDSSPFSTDRYLADVQAARDVVADVLAEYAGQQAGSGRQQGTSEIIPNDQSAPDAGGVKFSVSPPTENVAFKRWFGDSKVVDAEGKPLVVYHGTSADFSRFDPKKVGSNYKQDKRGFFFTPDPAHAERAADDAAEKGGAQNIMPVFVSIKNPLELKQPDHMKWMDATGWFDGLDKKRVMERVKAGAHDGIVVIGRVEGDRMFVALNAKQIKSATGNRGTFDPANADIRFSLAGTAAQRVGQAIDATLPVTRRISGRDTGPGASSFQDLTPGQQAYLSKIGAKTTPTADALASAMDRAGLKIRQGMVDRYAALKDLDAKAHGDEFINTAITDSSWVLAKMSSAASGALNAMMTTGRIEYDDKQKVIELKGEPDGGLIGALRKLGSPAEVERFFGWVAANRAEKLMAEGRENLFTPQEIADGKRMNVGRMDDGRPRLTAYAQAFKEFQQYRDDVLAIAEKSGIISPENRAMWRDEFYVPFYRVMDEDAANGPGGGKGLSRQEAFKKLKGGKENLNDLLENTLMNFNHLLSASLKNQAATQAIRNAQKVGIARKVPEAARDTNTSTFILENGRKVFYEVDDPLVYESITALGDPGLNNFAVRAMGAFKRVFTNMTTITPQFVIANTFRDLLQASATSPTSKNAFKNVVQGVGAYRDQKTRAEMLASGGAFSFGHIYGMDPDEVRASLRKTVKGAELITDPSMVPSILRKGWDAWGKTIDTSENISRAATYTQNVQDKGKLRAAFEARDVMDFSQHGAWPAIRLLVRVVPFLNARIQGLDKLYRSGVKPAIVTAMGQGTASDKEAAARFATVAGALTLASLALYMANAGDEEYQKLEEWQKDSYWFFRIGDSGFFLPKPFEVGAMATMAERIAQQFMDDKATGKLFANRMKDMLMQTFAFNPVPQAAQPLIDIYSNKDAFTGRDIETAGMERLSPGLRARDTTTAVGRSLSAVTRVFGDESPLAVSPVQADHLIKGYLGTTGANAAGMVDTIWRAATGNEAPDKRWSEYQPIRRFYRDLGAPAPYDRYSTLFYDGLRETSRIYADVQELEKLGQLEDAQSLKADKANMLRMRMQLNRAQRQLSDINKRALEVRRSDRDGEWKRRELDILNARKNLITTRYGKMIEDARVS